MRVAVTNTAEYRIGRAGYAFDPGETRVVFVASSAKLREIRACTRLQVREVTEEEAFVLASAGLDEEQAAAAIEGATAQASEEDELPVLTPEEVGENDDATAALEGSDDSELPATIEERPDGSDPGEQVTEEEPLACDADGCDFVAKSKLGLTAHRRAKHKG